MKFCSMKLMGEYLVLSISEDQALSSMKFCSMKLMGEYLLLSISEESAVEFNEVLFNEGDG